MEDGASERTDGLGEWLCLAALITIAFVAVPPFVFDQTRHVLPQALQTKRAHGNYFYALALAFALVLTAGSWRRSGLRVGSIGPHWPKVLIVCMLPWALTAALYPLLPWRPFAGQPVGMWLISPLAQDLVFMGYLYGRLERLLGGWVHRRVRIRWALVVTAAFFSAWHLPNFGWMPAGFVCMQLCYTFIGCIFTGLTRQWTGSILYLTLSHAGVNFIAWCMS